MKFSLWRSILVSLIFFSGGLQAQKEANIWYFGNFVGLDFNSGTAVPLNDGQINNTPTEGVATISDANGNLLFYTDGVKIWNRLHQVMPNGTGLFGSATSTQSAIIVPFIGDPTRYYVFTVDYLGGPKGLTYSVVNITLDGGNGDVETKNIALQSNVAEKITAAKHCNNRDIWVITHGTNSDTYYSFLVSPTGINATPVISHSGSVLWGVIPPSSYDSTSMGYLKASPDGRKIAAAHWPMNVDVGDFNNATGVVSNSYGLHVPSDPHYLSYGVEFSPNSRLVYTTVFYTDPVNAQKKNALFQYDISLSSPAAVRASKQVISQNSDPIQTYAALQLAPDGKLYMAKNTYKNIAAVNNPDIYGPGCNFITNAVAWTLPQQACSFGLPTFIQSYFYPPDSFTYNVNCPGLNVNFNYIIPANAASVLWKFGDPASGSNNSSTLTNPVHIFSAPGTYNVELIKFTNCGPDTLRRQVNTIGLTISLGADTVVCGANSILLNSAGTGSTNNFLWQDGSTNPTFTATSSGLYWVQASNSMGCSLRDSINVLFKPIPVFNLGNDLAICSADTLLLNASVPGTANYLWNTGEITPTIKGFQAGIYWCEVNNGCKFRDSLIITGILPSPVVNLGADQTLCEGITTMLDATNPNATYLWQDGTTAPTYTVNKQGVYFVQVNYNGCKKSDTVNISYNLKPRFTLGPDQVICPANVIVLSPVLDPSWQIKWYDGSANPTYTITQPGLYSLTATNNCGSTQDEMIVSKGACKVYVPTGFTPNNDGLNDVFRVLGTEVISEFNLKVFNRWGEIIFETNDKTKGWDGKLKGTLLSTGTFVYLLTYKDNTSTTSQKIKGTFVLVR